MDPRKSISRKPKTEDLTARRLSVLIRLKHLLLTRPEDIVSKKKKKEKKATFWNPDRGYFSPGLVVYLY